jgi:drug/metabolite transporter (DMT)-like permease
MRRPAAVDLLLLATVLIWAFNFTVTKYVLTHGFKPVAFSAVRYSAGALLFAAFTFARERSFRIGGRRDLLLFLAAAAVGIWGNQLAYVYAIKLTTATTVALILGATPIFTALGAFLARFERLSARFWIASVVSFAGVALVALGGPGGVSGDLAGDGLAVLTAATWGTYSLLVAPLMRRYSAFRISAIVLLAGVPLIVATGAGQLAAQSFSFGWLVWLGLVFATLGPLFLTNIMWFTAIDRVGPSRATLFGNMQPFFAAVFALLILSEPIGALQVAGGVAIGAGIVLGRKREPGPGLAPAPASE